MKRKKWTISEKLLWATPLLFVGLVSAMVYLPDASRSFEATLETLGIPTREMPRGRACQSNLKQIGLGVMQYVRDYDEKYPLAMTNGAEFGWAGLLQPYLKAPSLFHCPKNAQIVSTNPAPPGYTDYFYNARLSTQNIANVDFPNRTLLFGEGVSSDARSAKTQLPPNWVKQSKSPARLHFRAKSATINGANYTFADGHVKWFEPQNIGTAPASKGGATFSIR